MSATVSPSPLPQGRAGRILAVALALLALFGLSLLLTPVWALYEARETALQDKQALLERTDALVSRIDTLKKRYETARLSASQLRVTLTGTNDADAAAGLAQTIQSLAAAHRVTITSQEPFPARQNGAFRAISVRMALSGSWADFVALLNDINSAMPRLLVDDLSIQRTTAVGIAGIAGQKSIDSTLTVIGYRASPDQPDRSAFTP